MQFQFIARACHTQRALLQLATLGYVSVLEFFSIESYLKAISSDYGCIELQKRRLESAEERARARASSACAQTH